MGKILITYDLKEHLNESTHSDVKKAMKELGWLDYYTTNNNPSKWYLPNTTLWKKKSTIQQAKIDMKVCTKKYNAELERFKAVEYINWSGIKGVPYK